MGNMIKIIGQLHEYDIEIVKDDVADDFDVSAWVMGLKEKGFMPKPKFQKNDNTPFEPFVGTVEKIEPTKTKQGKDMWIAHVRPDKANESDPDKELVAFKFMNQREWRAGDRVKVTKNDKGWLEGHEPESDTPPPF